jgi:chromatin segregation and condensation protein Rec8/ScpA/Scc1 (kleisin family)
VLDAAGGTATLQGIADALHRARPRDLIRRKDPESEKGRDGLIIMLEEAGIALVEDDVVTLTDNWLEALDAARELGKEVEADELAATRHKLKSRAFHSRHQRQDNEAPTEDEMRIARESRPGRRRGAIEEAIARLFAERPEYRTRRAGQVTCALVKYLDPDFPQGLDGYPKDTEVEEILSGAAA